MSDNATLTKIDFKRVSLEDKTEYEEYLSGESGRGCEFSFANLYLWGRQSMAELCGHIVMFSQFDRRSVYPFPIGKGDKREVIDAIIADARERGIPCRITGILPHERQLLEELYPNRFRFHCDRGSFDYLYDIDDLADLAGKKYHAKRNHLNRFRDEFPDHRVEVLCEANIEAVRLMAQEWYESRLAADPEADFHMEMAALNKALKDREALGLEGIAIFNGESVLAFTLASRLSSDTFDVHFEKARPDARGAYTAINCEMAKYIREKYPDVRYLDREEDMGLEGLRKAKQSYYPVSLREKCWACLLEDGYDY